MCWETRGPSQRQSSSEVPVPPPELALPFSLDRWPSQEGQSPPEPPHAWAWASWNWVGAGEPWDRETPLPIVTTMVESAPWRQGLELNKDRLVLKGPDGCPWPV